MTATLSPLYKEDDGRSQRAIRTRANMLTACREIMCEGNFRPRPEQIATRAGCGVRSIAHHFNGVDDLYRIALDAKTRARLAILLLYGGIDDDEPRVDADRIINAVVFGRLK